MVNPGNTLQDCEEPFHKGWKYKMAGDKIGKKRLRATNMQKK